MHCFINKKSKSFAKLDLICKFVSLFYSFSYLTERNVFSFPLGYDNFSIAISTRCSPNDLAIFLSRRILQSFNHASFHLNNETCKGKQFNDTHVTFRFKFAECGTIKRTYNGSTIYTNLIYGHLKEHNDSKNFTILLTAECKIPDNATTNASNSVPHQDNANFVNITDTTESKMKQPEKITVLPSVEDEVQASIRTEVQPSVKPEMQTSVVPKVQLSTKGELTRITVKSDVQLAAKSTVHGSSDGKLVGPLIQATVQEKGLPVNSKFLPYK